MFTSGVSPSLAVSTPQFAGLTYISARLYIGLGTVFVLRFNSTPLRFLSAMASSVLLLTACAQLGRTPASIVPPARNVSQAQPSQLPIQLSNLPILQDESPSTENLFLGAVCPSTAVVSCENFAPTFRHGIALGTVYVSWSSDIGDYLKWSGVGSWPAQRILPDLTWMPKGITFKQIIQGQYDSYIETTAQELKAFGWTVFLRPFHEFNGNWYPWSLVDQGADQQADSDFIAAWRHMHDIFQQQGATNVRFVWCFSAGGLSNKEPWDQPQNAYPGDSYVDWVAFDTYNRGSLGSHWKWQTFYDIVQNPYTVAVAVSNAKPIGIIETASNEYGDGGQMKATWIDDMFSQMTEQSGNPFPHVRLLSWFEANNAGFLYNSESTQPVYNAFVNDMRAVGPDGILEVRSNGWALANVVSP